MVPGEVGGAVGGEDALRRLAGHLRAVAAGVEVRRAALGPASLGWWEGPAAQAHEERVARRRAELAVVVDDLRRAAAEAEALAALVAGTGRGP